MKEVLKELTVKGKSYQYYSLAELAKKGWGNVEGLPFSLKVLLENLARHCDNVVVREDEVKALCNYEKTKPYSLEISYHPARVLMQDFTGVPAVVDLATMRDAIKSMGGEAQKINPLSPVDLVIDHSVSVEKFGTPSAFKENVEIEFSRNQERYEFLRWGQGEFKNFRVVPPGTGICHQVNLEYLAKVVWTKEVNGKTVAFPDTLVGTDSHTTMVNGMAVLGWGVGGIEAEAAMLGQPVTMLIPQVVGFKLTGKLKEGVTATDLVLNVVQMLRKKGVVDKFVEFYGEALDYLSLADRATIANMAPEYGATCGFFPIDAETINYLKLTGREEETIELVEKYAKAQGMWREPGSKDPVFLDTIELDISTVEPCISGPSRPQDKILLKAAAESFAKAMKETYKVTEEVKRSKVNGKDFDLDHGRVVLASITSCTNTSNPAVLMAAGLLAKKASELGLKSQPWVKTSLAPGSQVVTDYLNSSGLQKYLDNLGFNLVGYGCTTCIGNSGPLAPEISESINKNDLVACAVLSGNRNFEGRISPDIKANFLASPPLVVAYAIAGSMKINITTDAIGKDKNGKDVYLKDIWPTNSEIRAALNENVTRKMFQERYKDVFKGPTEWQQIKVGKGETYAWSDKSTYIKKAPYFDGMKRELTKLQDIVKARPLAILADSVTTDHISPAGNIAKSGPAGKYLTALGVKVDDFNSYGSRRGNHEVMMRGTFANIRIKNEMLDGVEGGLTKHIPSGTQESIYDASMKYQKEGTPLVIFAGKEYGTGSSRDWAGKGTNLLGVKAVIAESFERIHRSNLIGMGVLPLIFTKGATRKSLNLDGTELIDIIGIEKDFKPQMMLKCRITRTNGKVDEVEVQSRINTPNELDYFKNGGILHYVLRNLTK